MGVPALFRWLSQKYPQTTSIVVEEQSLVINSIVIPTDISKPNPNGTEYDNLYLDMNGIIHPCCHPEDQPAPPTEEDMFIAIFTYIDRIMGMIRPRKLLYMAIDGVAPRAKMNQQRSRRFRAAQEAAIERETEIKFEIKDKFDMDESDIQEVSAEIFDSNCITPGTPFMANLAKALRYYIAERMTTEPGWKNLKVLVSDASVPGEGEHKIMDYIRRQRCNAKYDANMSHVLYGLDADLIMLGLTTHEPNFLILREDVFFQERNRAPGSCHKCGLRGHHINECTTPIDQYKNAPLADSLQPKPFILFHLNVLREYLEIELNFGTTAYPFDLERAIDDWVFLCFFVGNDFLPHLPALEIREGAIDLLIDLYRANAGIMGGYITEAGEVNLKRLHFIMHSLSEVEEAIFQRRHQKEQEREERDRRRNYETKLRKEGLTGLQIREALNAIDFSTDEPELVTRAREFGALDNSTDPRLSTYQNNISQIQDTLPPPSPVTNVMPGSAISDNSSVVAHRRQLRMGGLDITVQAQALVKKKSKPLVSNKTAAASLKANLLRHNDVSDTGIKLSPTSVTSTEDGIPFIAENTSQAEVDVDKQMINVDIAVPPSTVTESTQDTSTNETISNMLTHSTSDELEHSIYATQVTGRKRSLSAIEESGVSPTSESVIDIANGQTTETIELVGSAAEAKKRKRRRIKGGSKIDAMAAGDREDILVKNSPVSAGSGSTANDLDSSGFDKEEGQKGDLKMADAPIPKEAQDHVRLWQDGWKDRYYQSKFPNEFQTKAARIKLAHQYVEGLCWVLKYYYLGVQSWKWYYPYHYAPFAADFIQIGKLDFQFELGQPFKPLEQLMGVFPAASRKHIPEALHPLMIEGTSPIIDFYPETFGIDLNGKKHSWQGVALLPFIDEARLLAAVRPLYPLLDETAQKLNSIGYETLFVNKHHALHPSFEKLYTEGVEIVDIDPSLSQSMSGSIKRDLEPLRPDTLVKSPLSSRGLKDIKHNKSNSAMYLHPQCASTDSIGRLLSTAQLLPQKLTQNDISVSRNLSRKRPHMLAERESALAHRFNKNVSAKQFENYWSAGHRNSQRQASSRSSNRDGGGGNSGGNNGGSNNSGGNNNGGHNRNDYTDHNNRSGPSGGGGRQGPETRNSSSRSNTHQQQSQKQQQQQSHHRNYQQQQKQQQQQQQKQQQQKQPQKQQKQQQQQQQHQNVPQVQPVGTPQEINLNQIPLVYNPFLPMVTNEQTESNATMSNPTAVLAQQHQLYMQMQQIYMQMQMQMANVAPNALSALTSLPVPVGAPSMAFQIAPNAGFPYNNSAGSTPMPFSPMQYQQSFMIPSVTGSSFLQQQSSAQVPIAGRFTPSPAALLPSINGPTDVKNGTKPIVKNLAWNKNGKKK